MYIHGQKGENVLERGDDFLNCWLYSIWFHDIFWALWQNILSYAWVHLISQHDHVIIGRFPLSVFWSDLQHAWVIGALISAHSSSTLVFKIFVIKFTINFLYHQTYMNHNPLAFMSSKFVLLIFVGAPIFWRFLL